MSERTVSGSSSFGKFLETLLEVEKKESGAAPPERPPRDEAAEVRAGRELGEEMAGVLKLLDEGGSTEVARLLKASELPYQTFFDTVERLRSVNLVELDTESGEEVLTLTESGRALLGVLRSDG